MNLESPERPKAPFGERRVVVSERREAGPYVALTAVDSAGPTPLAGQFYMLRAAERWGGGEDGRAYLPRALSFARCVPVEGGLALDFLFDVVGPGTDRLANVVVGEELIVTGPFGNGFAHESDRRALLVGGGIGLAPIVALHDQLSQERCEVQALVGMRSAAHASALALYDLSAEVATDDGSQGVHGFVTTLLERELATDASAVVYACGPDVMLEAVQRICAEAGVPSQLAMESGMACGFGACYGCVVDTVDGYIRLCVDGPVIAGAKLAGADHGGAG